MIESIKRRLDNIKSRVLGLVAELVEPESPERPRGRGKEAAALGLSGRANWDNPTLLLHFSVYLPYPTLGSQPGLIDDLRWRNLDVDSPSVE